MASSVSPSSSASNGIGPVKVSNVVGFDLVACLTEIRTACDVGHLSKVDAAVLYKQVFPAYQSYLRKSGEGSVTSSEASSSVSSGVSSLVGGSPPGYKGALGGNLRKVNTMRGRTIRGLADWRSSAGGLPRGECYKVMLKSSRPELGVEPSFFALMRHPAAKFLPMAKLRGMQFSVCGGIAHVDASVGGDSALGVLCTLAVKSNPGAGEGSMHRALLSYSEANPSVVDLDLLVKYRPDMSVGAAPSDAVLHQLEQATGLTLTGAGESLELVRRSAAMLSSHDKQRLKLFSAVGDSVLTHLLAVRVLDRGGTVQDFQQLRSSKLSNSHLSALFVEHFDVAMFQYPQGVDPSQGSVGASFLEAMFGVVDRAGGFSAVSALADSVGVFAGTSAA